MLNYTPRYNEHDMAVFEEAPTRYHEKIRPGQATMLCASFSPGGTFFCVGSADHNVRVYQMNCPDGPQRILEEEVHEDRVDSIQWCNQPDQLRFISGSKDGTARIWIFKAKKWHTIVLNMKTGDNSRQAPSPSTSSGGRAGVVSSSSRSASNANGKGKQAVADGESDFRVTMVAWTNDDSLVVTAVSDKTLKIWDSETGRLRKTLLGHEEEIFVLEPHPSAWNLLLSSAHDGQIMIWDLDTGRALFKHKNMVEENGQQRGHAAIYDAKWSPDGLAVAASDSHGHLLFIGHGSSEPYDRLPMELFFHTDYRPLLRDSFHNVVDEQTQVPPHLLPPPFLVDSEGSPYPGYIQTFVPGREKMSEREALLPGEAAALGQARDNQLQQQNQQGQEAPPMPIPPIQQQLQLSAAEPQPGQPGPSNASRASQDGERPDPQEGSSSSSRGARSIVHPQRRILLDKECASKDVKEHLDLKKVSAVIESSVHITESNKVMFDHDYARSISNSASKAKKKANQRGRRGEGQSARPTNRREENEEEEDEDENEDENANEGEDTSDSSLDESDLSSMESTSEEEDSDDHSDWGSDAEEEPKSDKSSPSAAEKKKAQQRAAAKAKKRSAAQRCRENMLRNPGDITDDYMPSAWLSESFPKKTPYFPQIGDVLMYFKQGHEKYIDLVKTRKCYEVNMREQEWMRKKSIGEFCLVKVTNIRFEIRPPRLCVLKLALLSQNGMRATGDSFTIKYHDMNDVVDFLVLHDIYKNSSRGQNWKNGDRIRCQIDDCWWKGTVKKVEHHDAAKRSPFLSIYVHWDNGEKEHLSPWDLEQLTEDTADVPDGTPVTPEQLKQSLYRPREEEWNGMGVETESRRISEALETIMSLAIAEPFNYPVDLTAYPEYMLDVEYPMDLTLVKARVDNHFYRRIDALVYDIRFIHANAASFNRPRSDIVKNAKMISNLTLEIVMDPAKTKDDVSSIYHMLQSNFEWTDSDEKEEGAQEEEEDGGESEESGDEETTPRSSRSLRANKSSSKSPPNLNPKKWKHDCNELLNDMVANPLSVPFRQPVNEVEFPDYHRYITTPMDISTVRESLHIGDYASPVDFQKDVLLIFRNSREYNTDKKAKIWSMTNKLEEWFEDRLRDVVHEWRKTNRRIALAKAKKKEKKGHDKKFKGKGKGKGKGQSNKIRKSRPSRTFSEEDDDDEDEEEEETPSSEITPSKRPKPVRSAKARTKETSEDDNDDDDDDFEEKMPTPSTSRSRALFQKASRDRERTRRAARVSPPRPNMFQSQASAAGRRISSRIPKPPIRYRENLGNEEEEEEENLNLGRGSQRTARPTVSMRDPSRSDDDADADDNRPLAAAALSSSAAAATPALSTLSTPSTARPRRQRKPLRREQYTYSDEEEEEEEEEEGEDEEDTRPLSSQRRPRKRGSPAQETTPKKSTVNARPSPADVSGSSTRSRLLSATDEEDDLPLARKLSAKARNGTPISKEAQTGAKPAAETNGVTRALRVSPRKRKQKEDSDFDGVDEVGSEEEDEDQSEDDMPLRRRSRGAARGADGKKAKRDTSDESWSAKMKKKKKKIPVKKGIKKSEVSDESDFEDEDEESEDEEAYDSEEEGGEEEEEEEEEEGLSVSEDEMPIGKTRRGRPQRRAAMQPKPNTSKRAAQAIDSESERTSARRPSRLTSRNAAKAAAAAGDGGVFPEGSRAPREARRAAQKRSYFEGDDDEEDAEEEEEEEEDSARENRRPRRAASKRSRLAESDEDDFEDGDESEEDKNARGSRRKPNPRII